MRRCIWLLPLVLTLQGHAPYTHSLIARAAQGQTPPQVEDALWVGGLAGVVGIDLTTGAVENPIPYGFGTRAVAVDPIRDRI